MNPFIKSNENTIQHRMTNKFFFLTRSKGKRISWPVVKRSNFVISMAISHLINYPTSAILTYAWSFGALAGICLVIQILTGTLLSTHYSANIGLAFASIEYIMRDVPYGWLLRYIHANGASMFFIVLYAHIFKGLYYGSYMKPRQMLWCSGVILFLLVMGAAFTGYCLPWGQMSFWGATVITSMVTAVPVIGKTLVEWLWGGYTVKDPTLRRIYTVHFLLPLIIAGLSIIHLALLHRVGSTTPLGSDSTEDTVPFHPYYTAKDAFALTVFLFIFSVFVFYFPNYLNHPDNCIPADPIKTPKHLVPEWYFLPFYAILRSIPHKVGGIVAMVAAILVLMLLPFTYTCLVRNATYKPLYRVFFFSIVTTLLVLLSLGQAPMDDEYLALGKYLSIYYFSFFTFLFPIIGIIENKLATYNLKRN